MTATWLGASVGKSVGCGEDGVSPGFGAIDGAPDGRTRYTGPALAVDTGVGVGIGGGVTGLARGYGVAYMPPGPPTPAGTLLGVGEGEGVMPGVAAGACATTPLKRAAQLWPLSSAMARTEAASS